MYVPLAFTAHLHYEHLIRNSNVSQSDTLFLIFNNSAVILTLKCSSCRVHTSQFTINFYQQVEPLNQPLNDKKPFDETFLFTWNETNGEWKTLRSVAEPSWYLSVCRNQFTLSTEQPTNFRINYADNRRSLATTRPIRMKYADNRSSLATTRPIRISYRANRKVLRSRCQRTRRLNQQVKVAALTM